MKVTADGDEKCKKDERERRRLKVGKGDRERQEIHFTMNVIKKF